MGSHHSTKQNKFQDKYCNCQENTLPLVQRQNKANQRPKYTSRSLTLIPPFQVTVYSGGKKRSVTWYVWNCGFRPPAPCICVTFSNFSLPIKANPTRHKGNTFTDDAFRCPDPQPLLEDLLSFLTELPHLDASFRINL